MRTLNSTRLSLFHYLYLFNSHTVSSPLVLCSLFNSSALSHPPFIPLSLFNQPVTVAYHHLFFFSFSHASLIDYARDPSFSLYSLHLTCSLTSRYLFYQSQRDRVSAVFCRMLPLFIDWLPYLPYLIIDLLQYPRQSEDYEQRVNGGRKKRGTHPINWLSRVDHIMTKAFDGIVTQVSWRVSTIFKVIDTDEHGVRCMPIAIYPWVWNLKQPILELDPLYSTSKPWINGQKSIDSIEHAQGKISLSLWSYDILIFHVCYSLLFVEPLRRGSDEVSPSTGFLSTLLWLHDRKFG